MGIWNLDGVVWHSQLLPFVLQEKNIEDTIAMIVIDLSQPWNTLESLERWTQVLNKHINSLKIPEKKRRQMEENSESGLITVHSLMTTPTFVCVFSYYHLYIMFVSCFVCSIVINEMFQSQMGSRKLPVCEQPFHN